MTNLIKRGEFLNKWFKGKTITRNQNIIAVFTGSTGSGKTYNSLRAAEDWYKKQFKQDYPIENCCFSLLGLMKRITALNKQGKLRQGELFILEEAGANFGNLDFQHKLAKMFSYILQSFRSMNLILILTVPVLNMINKSARQLIHVHLITAGIDYQNKVAKAKIYMHQLAQASGKSYWKYPRINMDGSIVPIKKIKFLVPSERIIEAYEQQKAQFVVNISEEFIEEAERVEKMNNIRKEGGGLTENQQEIYNMLEEGKSVKEIAEIRGVHETAIYQSLDFIRKKGYMIPKPLEN